MLRNSCQEMPTSADKPAVIYLRQQDGNGGANKRKKSGQERTVQTTNKDRRTCNAYNAGSCAGKCGDVCPKNDNFIHTCSKRNSSKHALMDCPQHAPKKEKADSNYPAAP